MTTTARKTIIAALIASLAGAPLALAPLGAQAQAQAPRSYTQAELDQLLAPIALYPDALLSQVLMAATYPVEVTEAARWSRANPGLQGDAAVRAAQNEDWDPSVKSLTAFPQILQRMDEQREWTESLGDAFLANEPGVMDTVQQLRRRAQAAGNLQSTAQIRVQQQGPAILIQSPPEVVYVPYYDPLIVYGPWWWPGYRPVVWAPWPGYVRPRPGVSVGLWWGAPVGVSLSFFFGDFDWGRRYVHVARPTAYYYRPPVVVVNRTTVINRNVTVERNTWQHDPHHRRGVTYRAPEVRQRFADAQPAQRAQSAPQPATQQAKPEAKTEARTEPQREVRKPEQREEQRQTRERPGRENAAQREARPSQVEPRPQPQVQQERKQAEPRPQPQVQQERKQAEPRPQPQVQQERKQAEPRPQAQDRPEQPQVRQEQRRERQADRQERGERNGERNGKGGGDRS